MAFPRTFSFFSDTGSAITVRRPRRRRITHCLVPIFPQKGSHSFQPGFPILFPSSSFILPSRSSSGTSLVHTEAFKSSPFYMYFTQYRTSMPFFCKLSRIFSPSCSSIPVSSRFSGDSPFPVPGASALPAGKVPKNCLAADGFFPKGKARA